MESFDPHSLLGSTVAGDYRLVGLLGSGGIGHVFVAVPTLAARAHEHVALKLLRPELSARTHLVSRFEREALAASRIRHENVLGVERLATLVDGRRFFTMELLVGLDLADTMAHTPSLPLPRVLRIVTGVARGLAAAHAVGVVHRDIKPENVFLVHAPDGSERVKVLDFGTAFLLGDATTTRRITASTGIVGTPEYMAPEQLAGAEAHPSGDVYSLGVVLFELVTGHVPFSGGSWVELAQRHASDALPAIDRGSQELVRVLRTALAKEPGGRFPSMAAFELALAALPEASNTR